MEKFKAVEKEMKTKAYSKEGLLASARLDPKSQQKQDMVNFLSDCTTELDRQIEACEAEAESLAVTLKKGKKGDATKADRVSEVERIVERHKWHQGKLELIMRLLENGQLEIEQVERIKEDIKWYVESNQDVDFMADEDENIYDELNLDVEVAEDIFGMGLDGDRMSSQDTQSQQDDASETPTPSKPKEIGVGRRPSIQMKSPLPVMSTLHTPSTTPSFGVSTPNGTAKPAPLPARPAGELKYASVATAAAAAERNVGIAPLPPPPGQAPVQPLMSPMPPVSTPKSTQPPQAQATVPREPSPVNQESAPTFASEKAPSPAPSASNIGPPSAPAAAELPSPGAPPVKPLPELPAEVQQAPSPSISPEPTEAHVNGANGSYFPDQMAEQPQEESVFHLPANLQDLMTSFELTKKRVPVELRQEALAKA